MQATRTLSRISTTNSSSQSLFSTCRLYCHHFRSDSPVATIFNLQSRTAQWLPRQGCRILTLHHSPSIKHFTTSAQLRRSTRVFHMMKHSIGRSSNCPRKKRENGTVLSFVAKGRPGAMEFVRLSKHTSFQNKTTHQHVLQHCTKLTS